MKKIDTNLHWLTVKLNALGLKGFKPEVSESRHWNKWKTVISPTTCYNCLRKNGQRLVYSNDGIIFVTYDHYQTFYEII